MKRTALTGLFLTAALLGSPAFAADDLCGANLKTLQNAQVSSGTNLAADTKMSLEKTEKEAVAAQKAGDDKKCIELTTQAITSLKNTGSGNEGNK
ncbi:hypothetical protein [Pseudomonas sp. Irchel 3A5]|uniref:hypothetical protein n=1 Tax=Pseudomonas sp. Irchel 3A5 TaxID=2008911 RepID=UPI000BA4CBE4|nr:hypothetical protein [Pseudomonas sp. Irchel 3A5]